MEGREGVKKRKQEMRGEGGLGRGEGGIDREVGGMWSRWGNQRGRLGK